MARLTEQLHKSEAELRQKEDALQVIYVVLVDDFCFSGGSILWLYALKKLQEIVAYHVYIFKVVVGSYFFVVPLFSSSTCSQYYYVSSSQGSLDDAHQQINNQEKMLQHISHSLQEKDALLQEYMGLVDDHEVPLPSSRSYFLPTSC